MSPSEVARWAEVVDDHNPLHLDAEFAAGSRFGRPIVHGSLLFALIADALQESGAPLGSEELTVRFRAPVPVGSEVAIELRSGLPRLIVDGDEPVTITLVDRKQQP